MGTEDADHNENYECNPKKRCTCKKCCNAYLGSENCAKCVKNECPPECNPKKGCTCKKCCNAYLSSQNCAKCAKQECGHDSPPSPTPTSSPPPPTPTPSLPPQGSAPRGPYLSQDPKVKRDTNGMPAFCKDGTICSDTQSRTRCCAKGPIVGSMPLLCKNLKCQKSQRCPIPTSESDMKNQSKKEKQSKKTESDSKIKHINETQEKESSTKET